MINERVVELLIIGAGPAGMAAALRASQNGLQATVVDDNPTVGGQIWRGRIEQKWKPPKAVEILANSKAIAVDPLGRLARVVNNSETTTLRWKTLILATGTREIFLPFPGWTLPGIFGAGGLQALVKSGLPVAGKRVVIAGSGPLLLAVASYLQKQGANVLLIAEQADTLTVLRFGCGLARLPGKAIEAIRLKARLLRTLYRTHCWVERAEGEERLRSLCLRHRNRSFRVDCDFAGIAYGLASNTELASLAGCRLENGAVQVDEFQRSSIPGIFCAGEANGIGGVDLALVQGEIAGLAAAGNWEAARSLFARRETHLRFARSLRPTFGLRKELRGLPTPETIVCRCEDVRMGQLLQVDSWKAAKLYERCGMGPCQGRVCGPAVEFLFGWRQDSVRPPIFPANIGALLAEETTEAVETK